MPLSWQCQSSSKALRAVFTRLIAIFSSVIYIFAEDFGGLDDVATFLTQWIEFGNPSSLPLTVRPRVIVIVKEEEAAATYNVLAIEDLRQRLQLDRAEIFSSISIVHLAGNHISSLARHWWLKEVIFSEIEAARVSRIESRVLFSAVHFEAFFRRAVDHVAHTITEPFDFIQSSRIDNEIYDDYRDHLISFLRTGKDFFLSYERLTSFIASTILMDAYPPKMHSKSINDLFQSLAVV